MIGRLLIANRGEIACRIAATCRRLGIEAVGVFADVDSTARHVRFMDRALRLPVTDPRGAYLDVAGMVAVARTAGCDAVHPGYGFLAENPAFARACVDAGLAFIGPTAEAIAAMGDKDRARTIAIAAGVPVVPGALLPKGREAEVAAAIGYPLLIKPAAGGGGKGMRVAHVAEDLDAAVAAARREAEASFADDALLAERRLEHCRHVEVQLIADHHGRIVTAFERDCSLQRRHQKIVEEAPAPGLSEALRVRLADHAIRVAAAVGYRNLGTVEFLVAGDEAFFIEMNTRLQVEHPVTEAVTGLDLVEWQLRIAAGEPLPAGLVPAAPMGHAIEARLYAEDPEAGFLPSTGTIRRLRLPAGRLRVDAGIDQGDQVSEHFDPMIAKLIAHGPTREEARQHLMEALDATSIEGPKTNLGFLGEVLADPDFIAAAIHTEWLDVRQAADWSFPLPLAELALLVLAARDEGQAGWSAASGFRLNASPVFRHRLASGGRVFEPQLVLDFPHALRGGRGWVEIEGARHGFGYRLRGETITVEAVGVARRFTSAGTAATDRTAEASGALVAPMPGKVIALPAVIGTSVESGAVLAVLEAMKMEHPIKAPFAGRVAAVHVALGGQIEEGVAVVDLEPLNGATE